MFALLLPMQLDWQQLKTDYFLSSHMDVSEWGRQFFGSEKAAKSGNFYRHTKGWRKEKEEYNEQLSRAHISEIKKKRLANYIRIEDRLFVVLEARINNQTPVKDLYLIWQMLRNNQIASVDVPYQEFDWNSPKLTLADAVKRIHQIDQAKTKAGTST